MRPDRPRFRNLRNTSTFRLTLLLGSIALFGVVALLGLVYGLSARELNARSDRILRVEATHLAGVAPAALPGAIRTAIARSTSGLNYYGLLDPTGQPIEGNLRGAAGFTIGRPREIPARIGVHGPIRLLAIRASSGGTILVGRDITPVVDLRRRVTEVLLYSGLLIVGLILGAGVAFSIAPLRRVGVLQQTAQEIAAGNLERRMPILGRGDELDLFAGTVNTMIEEVGRVIAQVKAVTDAVANDVRTPLTRVRSQLARAAQQPDLAPDAAARILGAVADLDLVLERFAALLRISELEAGLHRTGFAPIAVDALIDSVAELHAPLAEEHEILLLSDSSPGLILVGDEKMLFEALCNLLDNAIKFTPPRGRIEIRGMRLPSGTCIEIRDNGPGIVPERRKSVLRRFDRGDASPGIEGTGLGLSVVAAILHLHRFRLDLEDAAPGLAVRIIAPDP